MMKPISFLENANFIVTVNPGTSTFSVVSRLFKDAAVHDSHLLVKYRQGRTNNYRLHQWTSYSAGNREHVYGVHGPQQQRSLQLGPDENELSYNLTFALPDDHPFLLWKLRIKNTSTQPVMMERLILLQVGFITVFGTNLRPRNQVSGRLQLSAKAGEPVFFSNGWQSWTHAGAYRLFDRFRRTRLGPFRRPLHNNAGTPRPSRAGNFSSDMFAVIGDRTHRTAALFGFVSQVQHFGSLEALLDPFSLACRMWANGDKAQLDPGKELETDWAYLEFFHMDSPDPLGTYIESVARQNGVGTTGADPGSFRVPNPKQHPVPVGWCSWYQYFQDISEEIIRDNINKADTLRSDLPLELIQIDDGYQSQVGDWLSFKETFPGGPAPLAADIKEKGFWPGIWLAPFILHRRSALARRHPDWLLRNRLGLPVNAGFFWNTFTTALDITIPEVLEYVREIIRAATCEWGFSYLKLDFLYAGALPGRYSDPTLTRAQALRNALQVIRQTAGPETTLVGCSCPLGSAVGLVDVMRVSADVAPYWHPRHFGTSVFFKPEPDIPSTRNAVHNSVTRAPFNRRWWINDPDCLLIRPESALTLDEVQTLATVIALTGGSIILSDDLSVLPPERLRIARTLLPAMNSHLHVLDLFDNDPPGCLQLELQSATGDWSLVALFNWQDKPADLELRLDDFYLDVRQEYFARDFWHGTVTRLPDRFLHLEEVPAHGCRLFALRPIRPTPRYLGSSLHVSQGLEVTHWDYTATELRIQLQRPGEEQGIIDIYSPETPQQINLNGNPAHWESTGPECYRIFLKFIQTADVVLRFSHRG